MSKLAESPTELPSHPDLRGLTINESKHERKCNNECREDDGLSVI